MPLYTFLCPSCGNKTTAFRKIVDRDIPEECETFLHDVGPGAIAICGDDMRRIVEAPAVQADIGGYTSPIDGRWIEGRVARHEDLKRNNCRPWEGMESEKKAAIARAKDADATFEKGVEKAVYDVYNNMSVEKQKAISQG